MKGKLVKQKDNWYVVRVEEGDWETFYPLHIDDINEINAWEQIFDNVGARIAANQEVEFEVVSEWENGEVGVNGLTYAKLISQGATCEYSGLPSVESYNDVISNTKLLDDKINAAAKQMFYDNSDSGWHVQFARDCFKEGAKWMKNYLGNEKE
jgi:hypothetical protein